MLYLVILVIALGWAGWFWSWGRDRFVSNTGLGLPPSPLAPRPPSALAPPRNATMARRRRREVLGALALAALLSFLLARAWSPVWAMHLLIDVALAGYSWAVYRIECGPVPERPSFSLQSGAPMGRLQPVLDGGGPRAQPGPRRQDDDLAV